MRYETAWNSASRQQLKLRWREQHGERRDSTRARGAFWLLVLAEGQGAAPNERRVIFENGVGHAATAESSAVC
jgi:hypothetical protein